MAFWRPDAERSKALLTRVRERSAHLVHEFVREIRRQVSRLISLTAGRASEIRQRSVR